MIAQGVTAVAAPRRVEDVHGPIPGGCSEASPIRRERHTHYRVLIPDMKNRPDDTAAYIPNARRPVRRGGSDRLAVAAESHLEDRARMPRQPAHLNARLRVADQ